jgi:alpha-beta hydrolase superfamily lysophospholipase
VSFYGTPLVGNEYVPAAPRAALIVLHGLSEHIGRYLPCMEHFQRHGLACFGYDQRGHGRSPGIRGDIEQFSQFTEDFRTIRRGIGTRFADLQLFVWGHSMGSIIALCAAADIGNRLAGVVTTGCAVRAVPALPLPFWNFACAVAAELPAIRWNPGLAAKGLSHDPRVEDEYGRDPLVHERVTLRLLVQLARSCNTGLEQAPSIHVPWLAIHGGADRIAPPAGSRQLINRLGSADKQLVIEPGLYHEVHNEAEPAASGFRERVLAWTRERIRRPATEYL